MNFKDLFSERASIYSRYRPDYPDALFDWIRGLVDRHDAVWDCATGSGQAAKALAQIFSRVIATDASAEQIGHAEPRDNIDYQVAPASESGLPDRSVNMVTVAQALHWFELDSFYAEVRRVLVPDGALVIWGYGDPVMETLDLEGILHHYNRGTIEDYWMPERIIVLERYANVPFPFREVATPTLHIERQWTLAELIGYVRTWSATANYIKSTGVDPVPSVEAALAKHWGGEEKRRLVRWPLHIRAGYLS